MDTDALTPDLLRKLREPKAYPAVSLTMPTHRREPDNGQDAVRLRNLMAEAGRRLDADDAISRQARLGIKAQLEKAADDIDLRRFLDGLAIFQFLWVWNDMLVALLFADSESQPLTVALQSQMRQFGSNIGVLAPGAFLSLVVPLVVFFAFQRHFVQGVMAGSVK